MADLAEELAGHRTTAEALQKDVHRLRKDLKARNKELRTAGAARRTVAGPLADANAGSSTVRRRAVYTPVR